MLRSRSHIHAKLRSQRVWTVCRLLLAGTSPPVTQPATTGTPGGLKFSISTRLLIDISVLTAEPRTSILPRELRWGMGINARGMKISRSRTCLTGERHESIAASSLRSSSAAFGNNLTYSFIKSYALML